DAIVRRDLQKIRLKLLALADVDGDDLVRQPCLLEEHRDLVAVRRRPVIEIDHGGDPAVRETMHRRKMRLHEPERAGSPSQWGRCENVMGGQSPPQPSSDVAIEMPTCCSSNADCGGWHRIAA